MRTRIRVQIKNRTIRIRIWTNLRRILPTAFYQGPIQNIKQTDGKKKYDEREVEITIMVFNCWRQLKFKSVLQWYFWVTRIRILYQQKDPMLFKFSRYKIV